MSKMASTHEVPLKKEALALRSALQARLDELGSLNGNEILSHSDRVTLLNHHVSHILWLISDHSEPVVQGALTLPKDDDGKYLLHDICSMTTPLQLKVVIEAFLEKERTQEALLHKCYGGNTPLHLACLANYREDNTDKVELLLNYDASRKSLLIAGIHGCLPIHLACQNRAPPKLIRLLLEADVKSESLMTKANYGQIPLHLACAYSLPFDSLQVLLDYDTNKRSVFVQDDGSRLPLALALREYCKYRRGTTPMSSIQLIFQSMLRDRVGRIGLQRWKNKILHKMIRPLSRSMQAEKCPGTKFFLEEACRALKALLEKALVLELVSWKMGCLREYGRGSPALNASQKKDCRTTSGPDVIVPGVISFLENEPVLWLLESNSRRPLEEASDAMMTS